MVLEKHQKIAIGIFIFLLIFINLRDEKNEILSETIILLVSLISILLYRLFSWFSGFGFEEFHAKDFGSDNHSVSYALFFWFLYIIVILFIVFKWRLY